MTWEPMTIDEYAAFQRATGAKVVKVGGTWWTEARPFFFRPLFPFAEVAPEYKKYPLQSVIGGVLHLVPAEAENNSRMSLFVYDDLKRYSLEQFGAKQRWVIRKSMEHFEARRVTDFDRFVEEASEIYASFYDRTRYFYRKERTRKELFAAWARPYFDNPKVVVTGAYRGDRLSAIDISYRVEEVIIDDVFFSDSESQPLRVTDFLVHVLREGASRTDARLLFRGFPTGKESLDGSKLRRGCKVLMLPAYCRINPVALFVGKRFLNESYRKLVAMTTFGADAGLPQAVTATE
jgi:hypothetical protein